MNEVKKRRLKKGLILFILEIIIFFFVIIFLLIKFYNSYKKYSNINNYDIGYYKDDNNYVMYSGYLWRILKVNNDHSIEIIMDDNYNYMLWNSEFSNYMDSDINKFLNNYFIKKLDTSYLSKSIICMDNISDIDNFSCDKVDTSYYVKIINYYDYVNSYLKDNGDNIWTSTISNDGIYSVNNDNIISSSNDDSFGVKPIVTLKNYVKFISGDGSIDNPYLVDKKDNIYNYYQIDGDNYISYYEDEYDIYLMSLDNMLYRYSDNATTIDINNDKSLLYYLNNNIYNNLSYKDILVKFNMYSGNYNGNYKDSISNDIEVYIGIPSVIDKVIDKSNYYLANYNDDKVYYVNNGLDLSNVNYFRNVVYTICISKDNKVLGNGSKDDPFIIEVSNE